MGCTFSLCVEVKPLKISKDPIDSDQLCCQEALKLVSEQLVNVLVHFDFELNDKFNEMCIDWNSVIPKYQSFLAEKIISTDLRTVVKFLRNIKNKVNAPHLKNLMEMIRLKDLNYYDKLLKKVSFIEARVDRSRGPYVPATWGSRS